MNQSYDKEQKGSEELSVTEAVHRLMRSLRRGHSGPHRHSRGYSRLLRILAHHEGSSSRELADLMEIRPASLAELLRKMEKEGFVIRKRDEKDRRIQRVFLSEQGKARLKVMKEKKADDPVIGEILSREERETFINLCNRLSSGLALRQEASPPDQAGDDA